MNATVELQRFSCMPRGLGKIGAFRRQRSQTDVGPTGRWVGFDSVLEGVVGFFGLSGSVTHPSPAKMNSCLVGTLRKPSRFHQGLETSFALATLFATFAQHHPQPPDIGFAPDV